MHRMIRLRLDAVTAAAGLGRRLVYHHIRRPPSGDILCPPRQMAMGGLSLPLKVPVASARFRFFIARPVL